VVGDWDRDGISVTDGSMESEGETDGTNDTEGNMEKEGEIEGLAEMEGTSDLDGSLETVGASEGTLEERVGPVVEDGKKEGLGDGLGLAEGL